MDSIYGGRPGSPFVIKARFSSIKEMQEAFQKGPDYKDVWYGEYCIIDTDNKNDFDNGKIYQRGTEYGNDTGDAKYVGQVVGPQSGVPAFDFASIDDIKTKYTTGENFSSGETRTWPYYNKESKKTDLYQDYAGKQGNRETIKINSFNTENGFIAGWTTDNDEDHFVDDIQYTWVNIAHPYGTEESNKFAVSKTLVGFKAPYPVFKATATPGDPYGGASVTQSDATKKHPFAYQWDFTIPKGKKGDYVDLSVTSFGDPVLDETGKPTENKITDGTIVQQKTITYEDKSSGDVVNGSEKEWKLNEIVDLYSDLGEKKSNHLYALFSSFEARKKDDPDANGYKQGFQSKLWNIDTTKLNWKDLGAIKDQSGILVGRDLNSKGITITGKDGKPVEPADVIDWLNKNYTDTKTIDGKVCTYLNGDGETWVFAWDYNKKVPKAESTAQVDGWYYVGAFGGGGTKFSVSEGGDKAPKEWYFKKAEDIIFYEKKNWWDRGEMS